MQTTTINRSWLLKIGIFALVMIAFGFWALYDAAYLYPSRGLADASAKLRVFLDSSQKAGLLRADKTATPNPRETLATLSGKSGELQSAAMRDSSEGRTARMELDRLEWLAALSRAWKLDATEKPLGEYTATAAGVSTQKRLAFNPATGMGTLVSRAAGAASGAPTTSELTPQALLGELNAYAAAAPNPTPLSAWDIPVQWSFVVLGFGVGGYLLFLLMRCKSTAGKYRYEEAEQRLTLPSGASFTPADIQDVDKRLWHKFYVTIVTNDGAHHKLDLLRYVPLEDWVLAMERTRFPERAKEDEAEAAESSEAEPASAEKAAE